MSQRQPWKTSLVLSVEMGNWNLKFKLQKAYTLKDKD